MFNPIKVHGGLQTYSNTSIQTLCSVQRSIAATTVKLAITRHGLHSHFFQSHHFAVCLPEAGYIPIQSFPSAWRLVPTADLCCNLGLFFFWRSTFSLSATVGQWALAFHAPPPGTGRAKRWKSLEDLSSWWWIILIFKVFTTLDPTSWICWLNNVEHQAILQAYFLPPF